MKHGADIEEDGSTRPPEHPEIDLAALALGVGYLYLH
jgi:hypothetical protein